MSTAAQRDGYRTINFEETELRLGLPGGGGGVEAGITKSNGKRGFSEDDVVDLKLNLSPSSCLAGKGVVRSDDIAAGGGDKAAEFIKDKAPAPRPTSDHSKPPAKAQVIGWPPVRSFRKNIMAVQKPSNSNASTKELKGAETAVASDSASAAGTTSSSAASFVKVSMDGAPYLRKVDLKLYKSYQQLSEALTKMFSSFTIGNCGSQGTKDFLNERKLVDLLNTSEYVPSYEDKDGDWMLVGDVPWEMFVDSCKRLRIMKGSEAIGLAPRSVEKCKSRS